MTGWLTDPGDLVTGLVILVTILGMGVSFVQTAVESLFHD